MHKNYNNSTVTDIAKVKNYWNDRPCNIRHSNKEFGSKEYFDEVEKRKYFVEYHIPKFAEFDKWKGKKILEIGCGMGTDAINFARNGADYTGVDLSDKSVEIAKKRFETYNLAGNLFPCNSEELTSKVSGSFDLIYSFGVIHHTTNPRKVIEEARKLIKDDGELRIMLYAKNSWKNFMIEGGYDQPEAQNGCPIAFIYDEENVKELLKDCFEVTSIEQDHIFPYVVEKYVKYEYELQPWFKVMPKEIFSILEKKLGWHMLIKAKPIK